MTDNVQVDTSKLREENIKNYKGTEETPQDGQKKKWVKWQIMKLTSIL
jgi:hypothetical protein